MSRYHSYLNSAKQILSLYNGGEPFASFLKKYFREHSKFGSKDRRQVSQLCYSFFRMGKAWPYLPVEDRLLAALFLTTTSTNEIIAALKPSWNEMSTLSLADKIKTVNGREDGLTVFPWKEQLSKGIDYELFNASFFVQPDLFLRLRPGQEKTVFRKLDDNEINYTMPAPHCVALPNSVRIDDLIELNREAVIQDLNSQRTGSLVVPVAGAIKKVWDCCAASGGKSIMAVDLLGDIELTVSDVRPGIIHNLRKRFEEAGIHRYRYFVADLSAGAIDDGKAGFDLIIADVPCSGSGTWGRTPEQLYFFNSSEIERYAQLQRIIVANALQALKKGGYLLYITCSVFKQENEENIDWLLKEYSLSAINVQLLTGYEQKADTLFAALLQSAS